MNSINVWSLTGVHKYLIVWYETIRLCLSAYLVGIIDGAIKLLPILKSGYDNDYLEVLTGFSEVIIFSYCFILSYMHLIYLKRISAIVDHINPQTIEATVYPFHWYSGTRILLPSQIGDKEFVHTTFDRLDGLKPLPEFAVQEVQKLPLMVYFDPKTNEPVAIQANKKISFIAPFPFGLRAIKLFILSLRQS